MYGAYLSRRIPWYVFAGALFAVLLASTVTLAKYNRALHAVIGKTEVLRIRQEQIREDIEEMKRRAGRVAAAAAAGPEPSSNSEAILLAVDTLKGSLRHDALSLSGIQKGISETSLPVEIVFNYDGYAQLIMRAAYLETLSFPFFRFDSLSIRKGRADGASCTIKGEFVMPESGGAT